MARTGDPNAKINLLMAAASEFIDKGLDRARVEEITARAGLSKGAFYLHFKGKEDAFRELVEGLIARLASFLRDLEADCGTARGRIDEFRGNVPAFLEWRARNDAEIFEFVWQNRGFMDLVLRGGHSSGYQSLIDEFAERVREHIERTIRFGVESGVYRSDLDVAVASIFLAGAYDRLARQIVRMAAKPDLIDVMRRAQEFIFLGMGNPAFGAHSDPRVNDGSSKTRQAWAPPSDLRPEPARPRPIRVRRASK